MQLAHIKFRVGEIAYKPLVQSCIIKDASAPTVVAVKIEKIICELSAKEDLSFPNLSNNWEVSYVTEDGRIIPQDHLFDQPDKAFKYLFQNRT